MAKDRETVLKYNPEGVMAEADKVLVFQQTMLHSMHPAIPKRREDIQWRLCLGMRFEKSTIGPFD